MALMILVSFSSVEDALSNNVKICNNLSSQGTENSLLRFFGTPGIVCIACLWFTVHTHGQIAD